MSVVEHKIQRALDISWKEGIPASMMLGVMDSYLTPFGLFLGASTQAIGFLIAVPHLVASLSQLCAVKAVRLAGSRLRFVVGMAGVQAALLLPVAALPFVSWPHRVAALIFLVIAFRALGNIIGSAWGSLMSDYLPPESRGRYFGWRSQVVGFAGIIGVGLAGAWLFFMKERSGAIGFALLFLAAAISRFISTALLARMEDLPLHEAPGSDFTFVQFIRAFRRSNFVRFVIYVAGVTFATYVAAPYFSVYMLKDLHFNYLQYMAVLTAGVITGLISFPIWGRHADLVGNARILKTTGFLVPMIPILWLFSKNVYYLVAVELCSGFAWAGFNLCATNFIYDAVTPQKRVRCLGYFSLIQGVSICAGGVLGGYLATRLPPVNGSSLLTLMLLSGLLRLSVYLLFSPHFQEVRGSARPVSSRRLFFSVLGIRPLLTVLLLALALNAWAEAPDLDSELCEAVEQGDYSAVEVLLSEGAHVDAVCQGRSSPGQTVLMRAADLGYVRIVGLILVQGGTFNLTQPHAKEVWIGLIGMEKLPIVDALLKTGVDMNYVDLQDDNGKTLLMAAAARGDAKMVRALLDRGAALEVKNKHGETALAIAAEMRRAEVVQLLIEEGAQIDLIDLGRWSPALPAIQQRPIFTAPLPLPRGDGRE